MNQPLYQYSCAYRIEWSSRVVHRTVVAADADDARDRIKMIDSRFVATVRSPRRGKMLVTTGDDNK